MSAFRNAHQLFTDSGVPGWIELDTQFTRDRRLVVIHDATLDRTTDCSGAVADRTLASLSGCDAADSFPGWPSFEPIPTLAQVMTEGAGSGWRLVAEIKNIPGEPGFDVDCTELAAALISTMRNTGFRAGRLIVQSFWPFCLDAVARLAPAVQTLFLSTSTVISDLTGLPVPLGIPFVTNALYSTLRGYDISAPDHTAPDLNAATVAAAHLLGRRVVVWTPNTRARMRELGAMGVDGVISDYPDRLIQTLGS